MPSDIVTYRKSGFERLLKFFPNLIISNAEIYFNEIWVRLKGIGFLRQNAFINGLAILKSANLLTLENRDNFTKLYKKTQDDFFSYSKIKASLPRRPYIASRPHLDPNLLDSYYGLIRLHDVQLLTQENFDTMIKVYEQIGSFYWLGRLDGSKILTQENFNAVTAHAKPDDLAYVFSQLNYLQTFTDVKHNQIFTQENQKIIISSKDPILSMSFILASYLDNLDPESEPDFSWGSWSSIFSERKELKTTFFDKESLWDLFSEINDTKLEKIARDGFFPLLEKKFQEVNFIAEYPFFGSLIMHNLKRGKALNLALGVLVHRKQNALFFPKQNEDCNRSILMNIFSYLGNNDLNNLVEARCSLLPHLAIVAHEVAIDYLSGLANPLTIEDLHTFTQLIDEISKKGCVDVIWDQIKDKTTDRMFEEFGSFYRDKTDPEFIALLDNGQSLKLEDLSRFQQQVLTSPGYIQYCSQILRKSTGFFVDKAVYLSSHRHDNTAAQQEYDKHFGLIPSK